MSKIFDALQRSVGERSGDESAALPHGPELLRQAEHRIASDWNAAIPVKSPKSEVVSGTINSLSMDSVPLGASVAAAPVASDTLTTSEQAELFSRFQSLPCSISQESRLVCLTDRESPTAEAVRLLAVRLRDMRRSRTLKKVLITSTIPREGKSTISANLACSLARNAEEKVLLVEGDVRLPALLRIFGIETRPGLCELLRDENNFLESIYRIEEAGLWILPAGIAPSDPLEILHSEKMSAFMDLLTMYFDWIIIDSPPVLPLADTSIWMRLADGVLLVTRQGVTERRQLQKGLEALASQKVLGALLNGSTASPYSDYYYGGSSHSRAAAAG